MKTCYLVERLGPYHAARLDRAAEHGGVTVIELAPGSATYNWDAVESAGRRYRCVAASGDPAALGAALTAAGPDVVFLNGWADRGALAALRWCLRRGVPAVLMSDSQQHDEKRVWWKEWIKRRVVAGCDAAFVAGQRHAEYLRVLGFGDRPVSLGYDVVDNGHFERGAAAARREPGLRARLGLPERYFLCVSRFIAKKNLPTLLRAFAAYRRQTGAAGWDLVLLGDGKERAGLESQIARDGLTGAVHLRGFLQYDALPAYYALAGALVLASTTDQWGLAVNEAMASGLPVLVSRACGCVPELVREGCNGFSFDPGDESALAALLGRLSSEDCDRTAMGAASREIIAHWSLDRFSDGYWEAARAASAARHRVAAWARPLFLAALLRLQRPASPP